MQYAHGEFITTRCGGIMVTQAYGPWNIECVNEFVADYRPKSECLHSRLWGDVVAVMGESLLVSDAESFISERVAAVKQLGLSHIAFVMGQSTAKAMTKAQLKRSYRKTGVEFSFFETLEEGLEWLRGFAYDIDMEALAIHQNAVAAKR